jgi:arylsulfatase A-like enzyme
MRTYRFLLASLGAACLFPPNAARIAEAADLRPRLNFLIIMADDLGAGELGCYGHATHQTPRLDQLAQTGARFRTCWATPICSPSRVEIMTGRYGFRNGWCNLIGRKFSHSDRISPDEFTFADLLKGQGYATGLAGKWQLAKITDYPRMIFDSGFDAYCAWAWLALPEEADFPGESMQRYWHPAVIVNGRHRPTTPRVHPKFSGALPKWQVHYPVRSEDCELFSFMHGGHDES